MAADSYTYSIISKFFQARILLPL